jgi:phage-related protein
MMYWNIVENKWKVLYYEDKKGNSEILKFIESKKESNQAKILAYIEKLEELGPNLPRPYSDILKEGIHELRIKLSGDQIRILYFFIFQKYIVLTHGFVKNTDKVPKREIEKAKKYRDDFKERISKEYIERSIKNENI